MDIAFRVRNVEVPEGLRRVTMDKVTRLAGLCGIDRADVCFSEERNPRIAEREVCEITLFGQGRILRAHAAATDVAVAAERVVGKLEQRADRLRGQLMRRRSPRGWAGVSCRTGADDGAGGGSVHFPTTWRTAGCNPGAVDRVLGAAGEATDMGISDSEDEPMTPEEAALKMGDRGIDLLPFSNAETGRPAVVYRRRDGEIALCSSGAELRS